MSKYDEFNVVEFCKKIYENHGKDYLYSDNLSFRNMSIDDQRSYVTVFNQLDYDNSDARKVYRVMSGGEDYEYDYNKKKKIQDKLNLEFDRRYDDELVMLYKFIDNKVIKSEKWLGEKRYAIWDYHIDTYSVEVRAFFAAYRLYMKSKELKIKASDMIDIYQMMSYHFYGFGKQKDNVSIIQSVIENPNERYEEVLK